MFISPTTHHARRVPRSHRSRAQYTQATIIAASSPPATKFGAWPSITACRPAELNASTAHARRPTTPDISLLTQVQTHRTRETHPIPMPKLYSGRPLLVALCLLEYRFGGITGQE